MTFLSLLVQEGVFEKIYVSFLAVGHTHEDIDQFFSRIAVYLRKNDALSRVGLERAVKACYHKYGKSPIVAHWDNLANISWWMDDSGVKEVPLVTKFRHFRIFKDVGSGRVWLQCREHMREVRGDHWASGGSGTHHECIPQAGLNLLQAARDGAVPPAQLRNAPPRGSGQKTVAYKDWQVANDSRMKYRSKRMRDMELFEAAVPSFTGIHKEDCLRILELEESTEEMPFHWNIDDITQLFNSGYASTAVATEECRPPVEAEALAECEDPREVAAPGEISDDRWLRFGPGERTFWIFRPGDDEPDNAPFLVGKMLTNIPSPLLTHLYH
jgi:hypothetical protein